MPELSKDDFQGAMNDSLMAEQIQRQTELLEEGMQEAQPQVQPVGVGGGNVGTEVTSQAMVEQINQLKTVLVGDSGEMSTVQLHDETIQQLTESFAMTLPEGTMGGGVTARPMGGNSPMLDKLDSFVQAQEEQISSQQQVRDTFGEVGDHIVSMQEGQEGMTGDKVNEMLSADRDFMADQFQQMVEQGDITNDQMMQLSSEMQTMLEQQEAGALAGDFTEKLTPLINSIEEETGKPLTDVRSALVNASGQMSLGDLMSNKFEILKGATVDSLGALKDSFMSGLNTLTTGLMGVFEGGQSITGLIWSAVSGLATLVGGAVAGAISWGAVGTTIAGYLGTAMTTAFTGALSVVTSPLFLILGTLSAVTGLANWFTGGAFSEEARSAIEQVPVLGTLYGMLDHLGIVGDLLQSVVDPIAFMGSMLGKGMDYLVTSLIPDMAGVFMDALGWLSSSISGFFDSVAQKLGQLGSQLMEIPGLITSNLGSIFSGIVNAYTALPRMLLGAVESGLRMVGMDGLANGIGMLQQSLRNLPNTIMSALKSLPGMITKAVQVIPGKITKAVYELPSMIWNKMQQLPSKLANAISGMLPGAGDIPGAETASSAISSIGSAMGFAEGGVIKEPTIGVGTQTGQVKTFAEKGPEVIVPTAKVNEATGPDTTGQKTRTTPQQAPASSDVMMSRVFGQGDEQDTRDDEKLEWLKKIYKAIQNFGNTGGDDVSSVPTGLTDSQALRISRGVI